MQNLLAAHKAMTTSVIFGVNNRSSAVLPRYCAVCGKCAHSTGHTIYRFMYNIESEWFLFLVPRS